MVQRQGIREYQLVVSTETKENRAINCRVEISLQPHDDIDDEADSDEDDAS